MLGSFGKKYSDSDIKRLLEICNGLSNIIYCQWIEERRKDGKAPLCASICPTDAIIYADLNEVMEEKRRRKAERIVEAQKKAVEMFAYFG